MYRSKKYKERELSEIKEELIQVAEFYKKLGTSPRRIFLCDGDALGASQELLVGTLKTINDLFPNLERVGVYATAQNMLDKSEAQLAELVSLKLNMAYLGLESGSDKLLKLIVKGNTREEMINGSRKLIDSGFKLSIIAMLGLGGEKYRNENIEETASVISEISPHYFSFLTTIAIPGTPYHRMASRPSFEPSTCKSLLFEMREILSKLNPKNEILFRANHVSNQYPIGGVLPRDSEAICKTLDTWIQQTPEGTYPPIPASM